MVTNGVNGSSSSSSAASSDASQGSALKLNPSDFLKLMITQLQHQDPSKPASSSDLLAQMSQIGQLQTSTDLQASLKSFGLQTSISSASSMIGKSVQGLDTDGNPLSGVVTSVQVQSGNVALELDNGKSLGLGNVTAIAPAGNAVTGPASH